MSQSVLSSLLTATLFNLFILIGTTSAEDCPPIEVITINGVGEGGVDHPVHDYASERVPGDSHVSISPDHFAGGCGANPLLAGLDAQREITNSPLDTKHIVVGHSMGGHAANFAWASDDSSFVCSVMIDPPPCGAFERLGVGVCAGAAGICESWDERGMADREGLVDTDEHDPFPRDENPDGKHCEDLKKIDEAIKKCIEKLRPNCEDNTPQPPPSDNGCCEEEDSRDCT